MHDEQIVDDDDENWLSLEVAEHDEGIRADRFLTLQIPELGRKLAGQLFERGEVRIDGRPAKKGTALRSGSVVLVKVRDWGAARPEPDIFLDIVLERDDLVICEKPVGIPSAALVGREAKTVAGALLARYPEMANVGYGPREPGLLHRLDTQTSGLLLAARTQQTFLALREALSSGRLEKRYWALVSAGCLRSEGGTMKSGLCPDPADPRRVVVRKGESGSSFTSTYRILKRGTACDWVEVSASPAYRHQVRVHLADAGAPLLGDALYGGDERSDLQGHALHASYIAGAAAGVPAFEASSEVPRRWGPLLDD